MKSYQFVLLLIGIFSLAWIFIMGNTIDHERIHVQINTKWGINSTVKYDFNPFSKSDWTGLTTPIGNNTSNCQDACKQEHLNLEIEEHSITANSFFFFVSLSIILIFYYAKHYEPTFK